LRWMKELGRSLNGTEIIIGPLRIRCLGAAAGAKNCF
ncbi:MAG: hypothetical protein ACI974_001848, partial [Paraglaciecola sp.]